MLITTERLILRSWRDSDAPSLYTYAKDPDVGPIAGWPPHQSEEASLQVIRTVLNGLECYAVCRKEDGLAIGAAELILSPRLARNEHECELGFWLGKPFWGRGYMPEASRALLSRAFEELGMTAVWCAYFEGNTKSRRVQEKLGFVPERVIPDFEVPLFGEKRVCYVNLLTAEQWSAARKTR